MVDCPARQTQSGAVSSGASSSARAWPLAALLAPLLSCAVARTIAADLLGPLTFRHIGPVGNRITMVASVPGDPLTYYIGAARVGRGARDPYISDERVPVAPQTREDLMRFLRPLLVLLALASCVPGPTAPMPTPDLATAPQQRSVQPLPDQPIAEAAAVSYSSAAMRKRAGKKWPWIVAGVVVVGVIVVLIASSNGGGLGY